MLMMLVMLDLLVALVAVVVILHLSAAPFTGVDRVGVGVVEPSLDNGQGVGQDVPGALEQIVSQE